MRILLPLRISGLPSAVPNVLSLIFLLSALLKLLRPGYLCGPDPWAGANLSMIPLEFALAWLLWTEKRRELGGLLGCATMVGAGALLTWAHLSGRDVRTCGCFGPIEMSYVSHMILISVLFGLSFLTLISSGVSASPSGREVE